MNVVVHDHEGMQNVLLEVRGDKADCHGDAM